MSIDHRFIFRMVAIEILGGKRNLTMNINVQQQAVCALRSQCIVVHLKIKSAGTSFAFARGHVNISIY